MTIDDCRMSIMEEDGKLGQVFVITIYFSLLRGWPHKGWVRALLCSSHCCFWLFVKFLGEVRHRQMNLLSVIWEKKLANSFHFYSWTNVSIISLLFSSASCSPAACTKSPLDIVAEQRRRGQEAWAKNKKKKHEQKKEPREQEEVRDTSWLVL